MKARFSAPCGRSSVKMADRFTDISESDFHLKQTQWPNDKTIIELDLAKYLDFSVVTPLTNTDILLNFVQ